jgi:tetratricopeptide (TPR) repeat protein
LPVFSWSYDALSDPAKRLFRLLGLHAGADIAVLAAASLAGLPVAHDHLGHHAEAVACFGAALELFREFGDRYNEAITLNRLGDAHAHAGHDDNARTVWRQALSILRRAGTPRGRRRPDQARRALSIFREPGADLRLASWLTLPLLAVTSPHARAGVNLVSTLPSYVRA